MPRPSPGTRQPRPTATGPGVPAASKFIDLDDDDEDTVTYDARRTPTLSLPALLAECVAGEETGGAENTSMSDADIDIVATAKSDGVESNIHRIAANRIIDDLAPPDSNARISSYAKVPRQPISIASSNRRDRVSASAFLHVCVGASSDPQQSVAPAIVRPRRSPKRSFLAKFLFVAILALVLMIAAIEISSARHLPWLDPRPLLVQLWNLVAQKIPWESLPKLPKL